MAYIDWSDIQPFLSRINTRLDRIENQLAMLSNANGVAFDRPASAVPQEIVDLAHSGQKIEAIKRYRQLTNVSLEEARNVVMGL